MSDFSAVRPVLRCLIFFFNFFFNFFFSHRPDEMPYRTTMPVVFSPVPTPTIVNKSWKTFGVPPIVCIIHKIFVLNHGFTAPIGRHRSKYPTLYSSWYFLFMLSLCLSITFFPEQLTLTSTKSCNLTQKFHCKLKQLIHIYQKSDKLVLFETQFYTQRCPAWRWLTA